MGITTVERDQFQFLTKIHYLAACNDKFGEHEIDHILLLKSEGEDIPYNANPNEVSDVMYVDQEELKALMDQEGVLITPWFK